MPEEGLMHVGILNPKTYRKEILENAISTIKLLKGFERINVLRKEKEIAKSELKSKLRELNKLIKEFNTSLPKVKIPELKITKEVSSEKKSEEIKVTDKKIKMEHKTSNLDKLDQDIDLLRKKLESL